DIGGDLFALVWDGAALHGLNASGRSPAALTLDAVRRVGVPATQAPLEHGGVQAAAGAAMPAWGWLPATLPGAPAGWRDLDARFGTLPFADLFSDSMRYAEQGYPVSPMVAQQWQRAASLLHPALEGPEFAEWGRVFAPSGRAPRAGERWRN